MADAPLWSEKTMTIKTVIEQERLPVVVRVEEGLFCQEEAESFSQGDILKLDWVLNVERVAAMKCSRSIFENYRLQVIESENDGYVEPGQRVFIPLKYKGLVKMYHDCKGKKIFENAQKMIKCFPRFVQVLQTFTDVLGHIITAKTELELDRVVPEKGLVCFIERDKKNVCLIDPHTSVKFLLLEDPTEYTIHEIVERFPLPQTVEFVEKNIPLMATGDKFEAYSNAVIFTGQYQLNDLTKQSIIIGHSKLSVGSNVAKLSQANSKYPKTLRRAMVIIPLDSEVAREVDVRLLLDDDKSQYELFVAKNFQARKGVDVESLGGVYEYLTTAELLSGVYLHDKSPEEKESAKRLVKKKTPNVITLQNSPTEQTKDLKHYLNFEELPRVPNRKKVPRPKEVNTQNEMPVRPPRLKATNMSSDKKIEKGKQRHDKCESSDDSGNDYEPVTPPISTLKSNSSSKLTNTKETLSSSKLHKHGHSNRSYMLASHEKSVPNIRNKLSVTQPIGSSGIEYSVSQTKKECFVSTEEDDSDADDYEEVDDYEQIDEITMVDGLTDDDKAQAYVGLRKCEPSGEKSPRNKYNKASELLGKIKNLRLYKTRKGKIAIETLHEQVDDPSEALEISPAFLKLTVQELCTRLQVCGMPNHFIKECHTNKLDGAFFGHFTKTQIGDVFHLNALDTLKFLKIMSEDWSPKT